jgi:hypothetical protein
VILGHDQIALLLSSLNAFLNESTIERNLLGRKLENNTLLATACLKLFFWQ